jgi:acyl-coenzyme A thioesterase PaaI-like protein
VIERLGNRMANVEAFAWQGEPGRPIASARINFLLERPNSR